MCCAQPGSSHCVYHGLATWTIWNLKCHPTPKTEAPHCHKHCGEFVLESNIQISYLLKLVRWDFPSCWRISSILLSSIRMKTRPSHTFMACPTTLSCPGHLSLTQASWWDRGEKSLARWNNHTLPSYVLCLQSNSSEAMGLLQRTEIRLKTSLSCLLIPYITADKSLEILLQRWILWGRGEGFEMAQPYFLRVCGENKVRSTPSAFEGAIQHWKKKWGFKNAEQKWNIWDFYLKTGGAAYPN